MTNPSRTATRDVYVYYRVSPEWQNEAAQRVDALLARLAPLCAEPPRRKVRCDDATTWMEIYPGVTDLERLTRSLVAAAHELSGYITDQRHIECFTEPVPNPP